MTSLVALKNRLKAEYAFFPGCTALFRAQNYELSTLKIAEKLGIRLIDLDFTCCGFPLKPVKQEAALLMSARNLALAEEEDLNIVTICNTCAKTLTGCNQLLRRDRGMLGEVNKGLAKLGYEYRGGINVKHLVRVLYEDLGIEEVREKVERPLDKLRVSTHYGCHYSRPSDIYDGFDDPENPRILDELVEATGAKVVPYGNRKMCCGGPLSTISPDTALSLSNEKLNAVASAGADALIVICPFCSLMYDLSQKEIEKTFHREYHLPILYLPQLLGLSMGLKTSELGLDLNTVDTGALLDKV